MEVCASECCLQLSTLGALLELGSGEVSLVVEVCLVEVGVAVEMSFGEICLTVELGLTTIETCYASSLKIDRFL